MFKKDQKEKRKQEVMTHLLIDPTQGSLAIAKQTGLDRRTVYQIQKDFEKNQTIWGYTTVVDWQKLGRVVYLLQFKTKPLTKQFADLIHQRLTTSAPEKHGVYILDVCYMNGPYDVNIRYAAPDHETARAYYEALRAVYKDHFEGELLVSYMNACFVQTGKLNPELKQVIQGFIPKIPKETK